MVRARKSAGFSLIELLIVIALMGIMVGLMLPSVNPGLIEQLRGTAQVLSADLSVVRSLAVANNSQYRVSFSLTNNSYTVEHTGSNTALNTLPPSPFHPVASSTAQTVVLHELPGLSGVRLAAVAKDGGTPQAVTNVEFGPLGETTRPEKTVIWLTTGPAGTRRFIAIEINPVTGLCTVAPIETSAPPAGMIGHL